MSNKAVFDSIFRACTLEYLESRGVVAAAGADGVAVMEHAAVIGFSGSDLRGVVGLGMAGTTLRQIAAARRTGAPVVADDWLGEAANQLLGRVKNKLLGYGAVINIALPMVLRGVQMHFSSSGAAREADGLWTYAFDGEAGPLCVWLDVRVKEGFQLTASDDPEMQGLPEGDLTLF